MMMSVMLLMVILIYGLKQRKVFGLMIRRPQTKGFNTQSDWFGNKKNEQSEQSRGFESNKKPEMKVKSLIHV